MPAVLIISAAGFDNRSVTFNDNDDNIEISLQPSNTDIFDEIPEGTVIADFYLPYSCCSDCAPIQFTVKDPEPNKPPVAVPGESRIIFLPENSVTLDGSQSSDPDGTVNAYAWKQVSGPADANFSASTDPVIMVSELNIGDYVFTLTVTDNSGATDTKQITITVKEKPNEPPVAVAFAQPAIITIDDGRATVLLDGSNSSDPEHSALIYLWSQDAAQTGATIQNNALANTDVNFSKTGRFNFRLTVTDDKGAASFADVLVIVNEVPNEGPVAVATADPNPARLSLNFEVNVSLHAEQSADPEGNDLVFEWLQPATQANAVIADPLGKITNVHITAAGDYNFTIRVTDDHNNSATDTVTVKVLPADIPQGKQCGPLPVIVDGFGKLQGTIKIEVFNAFKNRFGFYNEVEAYFKILQEIENENADVHFEFFNRLFENQLTPVLIQKWLIKLQEIIIANKEFRVLALRLYRVLIALSTYIVCIQDKDFDQQIVLMVKVFTQMRRHFIQWKDLFSQGLFSNTDLKLIEATGLGIELEIKKVVQNGEENDKANYIGLLKELLLIIRSIR